MLFLVLQATNVLVYTQGAIGAETTFALGFFLGAFQGGLASGLMPNSPNCSRPRLRQRRRLRAQRRPRPGLGRAGHDRDPGGALAARDAMVVCALSAYAVRSRCADPARGRRVDLRAVDDEPAIEKRLPA